MKIAGVVRALRCLLGLHSKPGAHVGPEILIAVIAQRFDKAGECRLRNTAVLGKAAGSFIDDLIRVLQNGLIDGQIIRIIRSGKSSTACCNPSSPLEAVITV